MAVTLVLETGAGLTNSTSYVDRSEFEAYWTQRGVDYTSTDTYPNDTINLWLNSATFYADTNYNFCGIVANSDQALQWPRGGVYDRNGNSIDDDVIPTQLKNAICELAVARQATTTTTETTGIKSKSVGPLSVQYTSGNGETKRYVQVDNYLIGLVCTNMRINLPK